jgi:hypothetical protein
MVAKRLAGNRSPATRDMRTYVHRLVFDEDPRR